MRLPSGIAAGSVAIALFAGGFAVGHGVHNSSSKSKAAGKPQGKCTSCVAHAHLPLLGIEEQRHHSESLGDLPAPSSRNRMASPSSSPIRTESGEIVNRIRTV